MKTLAHLIQLNEARQPKAPTFTHFVDPKLGIDYTDEDEDDKRGTAFADLSQVSVQDVRQVLDDVRAEITFLPVSSAEHDKAIREFVEDRTGGKLLKGSAFYQLTKGELKVQDYKLMAVRNKKTGEVFASRDANQIRSALGLPAFSTKMSPADLGEWDLFIQSTSTNRKVVAGTDIMYWPSVGKRFKEGKSA